MNSGMDFLINRKKSETIWRLVNLEKFTTLQFPTEVNKTGEAFACQRLSSKVNWYHVGLFIFI